MQIKHGGCCLSVCRRLCALINLCNFNRHKWGCYRFCVTGWALEHWLIGYGWIIHLNHRTAAWLCGPCQWMSVGWRAECWEWCDDGRVKMIHALSVNFSSSAEMLHLFFCQLNGSWLCSSIAFFFFHHRPHCTIKHFQHAQISADELISSAAAT